MVARAVGTPAGRSSETLEQIDAYGFAGSLPTSDRLGASRRLQGPHGLAHRFDRPLGGIPIQSLPAARLPQAAHLRRHVQRVARAAPRHAVPRGGRRRVPLARARRARRHAGLGGHLRHGRGRRLRLHRAGVRRRSQGPQASRADREGPARPHRPRRRDARGRAQLPAVAAARGDQDQGAARRRGPADAPGAEHGPHARRGARELPQPHRHARRAHVRAVDRAGRGHGRLDRPDHAQPRGRAPEAPKAPAPRNRRRRRR